MYNKLFTKILDSSIWLAPDPHRLVWITLVAAMDEDAIAHFACAENLAARARVSLEDTEAALASFLAPDPYGPDQEHDGRRIERVPGGWYLLNGLKYRTAVTRSAMQEQNRERVRRWREKHRDSVTSRRDVTTKKHSNVTVMHAEALAEDKQKKKPPTPFEPPAGLNLQAWESWQGYRKLKPASIPAAMRKLAAFGDTQAAVVEQSIANGWKGLFELKTNGINGAGHGSLSANVAAGQEFLRRGRVYDGAP